jgi:hypothetical protein
MMRVDTEELTEAGRRLNSFAIHLLRAMRRVDAESGVTPARLSALCGVEGTSPLRSPTVPTAAGVLRVWTPPAACDMDFPQDRGGFRYAASGRSAGVVVAKATGDIIAAEL